MMADDLGRPSITTLSEVGGRLSRCHQLSVGLNGCVSLMGF